MDYVKKVYVYSCTGSTCSKTWSGSSRYYSGSWCPTPNCHFYGTGVKTSLKIDPDENGFTAAYLDVEAGYHSGTDIETGSTTVTAIVTFTNVANDPEANWIYGMDYAGYTID